jgi:hypothetical protein
VPVTITKSTTPFRCGLKGLKPMAGMVGAGPGMVGS